ncbi:hypothetical protein HFO33_02815 [Rhizobium leguminosarum]|uniref:hypothetical protein n=1 Tax=Rhizobium TaxID=379 RepID=UPI001C8FDA35|nr:MULTISPECIES: hypothetical protein [Rhizobium]MBY3484023.1 hypothetical protein [Rhizobium laguerreae]MBY5715537.1 hypothetical protein [Rhizobium leguminosarum]
MVAFILIPRQMIAYGEPEVASRFVDPGEVNDICLTDMVCSGYSKRFETRL